MLEVLSDLNPQPIQIWIHTIFVPGFVCSLHHLLSKTGVTLKIVTRKRKMRNEKWENEEMRNSCYREVRIGFHSCLANNWHSISIHKESCVLYTWPQSDPVQGHCITLSKLMVWHFWQLVSIFEFTPSWICSIGVGAGPAGLVLVGSLFWRFNEVHYKYTLKIVCTLHARLLQPMGLTTSKVLLMPLCSYCCFDFLDCQFYVKLNSVHLSVYKCKICL